MTWCPPPWGLQPCKLCMPNKITVGTLLISDHSDCWSLCTHGGASIALESGNLWMWENLVMMLVCACTDCQGRARKTLQGRDRKSRICSFGLTQWKINSSPRGSQSWGCCSRYLKVSLCDLWQRTLKNFKGLFLAMVTVLVTHPFIFCFV